MHDKGKGGSGGPRAKPAAAIRRRTEEVLGQGRGRAGLPLTADDATSLRAFGVWERRRAMSTGTWRMAWGWATQRVRLRGGGRGWGAE